MAKLANYQKITRVRPTQPFGDAHHGPQTSSGAWTTPSQSVTGTAGASTVTIAAAGSFVNGDLILLHQTRGTGVGQWEINLIVSGGGTTTLTLSVPLQFTYTDSGASQAQCCLLYEFSSFNPSGTFTGTAWAGNVNGLAVVAVSETLTMDEIFTESARGSLGGAGTGPSAGAATSAKRGEGNNADNTTTSGAANGTGAGGGVVTGDGGPGGGGGGHGAAGTAGENSQGTGGAGGTTGGSADLTTIIFGGAGGGGAGESNKSDGGTGGAGGVGGGIVMFFARNVVATAAITASGGAGANATNGGGAEEGAGGGGGGGGGSILICGENVALGTAIAAIAGAGGIHTGSQAADGGAGGTGRIAVHYGRTVTGTTNPTYNSQQDNDFIAGGTTPYFL